MRRREAVCLLAFALVCLTAGLTVLFGALALIGAGALSAAAAFYFEIKD